MAEHTDETQLIMRAIRTLLNLNTNSCERMLDVGCGSGRFSEAMAPYVERYTLLDPDPDLLAQAGKSLTPLHKPRKLYCCRIEEANPLQLGQFEIVLLAHVLYYVPNWRSVLDECLTCLTSGGTLLIVLWSSRSDLFRYSPEGGKGEVTSELVRGYLRAKNLKLSSIDIKVRVGVVDEGHRRILAQFLGYSDTSEFERQIAEKLKTGFLIDRQQVVLVRKVSNSTEAAL